MSRIPCYIVEEHQEIVEPLFKLIKSKRLAYEGLFLLNIDSHSDLSVPMDLCAEGDGFLDKNEVLDKIDIESWIIPLYYMDIVKSLCWLHPDWTKHSFKSESHFKVGKVTDGNEIKVTSASNYFISEDDYEHESKLCNLHAASLFVHSLPSQQTTDASELALKLKDLMTQHSEMVLSIDLDFFSVNDPFVSSFSHNQYSLLKKVYAFQVPVDTKEESIDKSVQERRSQLKKLKEFFTTLQNKSANFGFETFGNAGNDLKELVESLISTNGPNYDWEWLHEIGRGIDDCPLPHHPASSHHITTLLHNVESLLLLLQPPKAVFICRSSDSDFCPKSQVEQIQQLILTSLHKLYPQIEVFCSLKNDSLIKSTH